MFSDATVKDEIRKPGWDNRKEGKKEKEDGGQERRKRMGRKQGSDVRGKGEGEEREGMETK